MALIGLVLGGLASNFLPIGTELMENLTLAPVSLESPTPIILEPERLIIEKIGINAIVEKVGLTENKAMDVPKEKMNVAWYELGNKPGETGSAVIAGHYDWYDGAAVFFKLNSLEKGDVIETVDTNGQREKFSVTDKALYKNEEFPISLVFSRRDKKRLNLITCDGIFNRQSDAYNEKLVIFSEAIE